jgi:hypothetical protein
MKLPKPLLAGTFVAAASVAAMPAGQAGAEDVCKIAAPALHQGVKQNPFPIATFAGGKLQVRP